MNKCSIQFDQNEFGTYFTGQVVTGRVIINMNKPKKLKGIKLQISGYACAQWQQRRGKRPRKAKKHKRHVYYGREDYIASTTYLVGSEGGEAFTMEGGSHTFTFACPIPANCPSSFEGTFGHIRYLAKVTFVRPGSGSSSSRTHTVGFTVLKLLDLNQESRLLKAPANNEAIENFCLLQTKAVALKVDVTQTGYVPGQMMLVSVRVDNASGFDCRRLAIFLNLRATYTSDTPRLLTASEKICLAKRFCGPVQRGTSKDFAETMRIPATPPTCEHLSKVVRVSYEVCVVAQMNRLMRNPKTVIPITIGNVPLTGAPTAPVAAAANGVGATRVDSAPHPDEVPTTSSCAMQRAGGDDHRLLSEVTSVAFELPPPTYEEAMFMTADIAEQDGDGEGDADGDDDGSRQRESVRFTPRYPVYNVDAALAAGAQGPAGYPVKPQKRRRRKKKATKAQEAGEAVEEDRPPVESPVQI